MNTTRTGKIARLPKATREELNLRLENGESGPQILAWLNNDRIARFILEELFENPAVSEQNLSEWRKGGYQDWLRQQQSLGLARQLVEESRELAGTLGNERLPDHFATLLSTEFIKLAKTMLAEEQDTKQRWTTLCDINAQLSRIRRDDHRATYALIHKEQWIRKIDDEEMAEAKAEEKEECRQNVRRYQFLCTNEAKDYAPLYGTDDIAHDLAAMTIEQQEDLEFGALGRKSDFFALRKHPDEPKYPWNRRRKKAIPATPTPDPSNPPAKSAMPTPATPPSPASAAPAPATTSTTEMIGRSRSIERVGDEGAFGVPSRTRDGGTQGSHVMTQETSSSPLPSEDVKPSEPSPRGRGQGELPSREAANTATTGNSRPVRHSLGDGESPQPAASTPQTRDARLQTRLHPHLAPSPTKSNL